MAMLKPKLKMTKATAPKGQMTDAMHGAVQKQRKSELQMERQIAKRARDGYR